MEFVTWCGLFKIGHPVIDQQHRELFRIVNEFHDQLTRGQPSRVAIDTLNGLIKFAQEHFADEEVISKEFGYPEEQQDRHRHIHEKLIYDIFDLHKEISGSESIDLKNISNFLNQWIILHILIEDNQYKAFLDH